MSERTAGESGSDREMTARLIVDYLHGKAAAKSAA